MLRIRLAYKILFVLLLAFVAFVLVPDRSNATPIFASAATETDSLHPVVTFQFPSGITTLPDAFAVAGQEYRPEDHIQVFPPVSSGLGGVITDAQALPITLVDGTKTYTAYTWAKTVEELLSEQNVILGDQDKISPAPTTLLANDQTITIVRVAITQLTERESIAYDTVRQDDPTLDKGKSRIQKAGVTGEKALLYEVRREDGVEVSRRLLSTTVTKPAEAEILLIGTKPVITRSCGGYNNTVLAAAIKNNVDPNLLCKGLMLESNGHANSVGSGQYYGLFQYTQSFWAQASTAAGYGGASWSDPTAQIYTTAWALNPVRYNLYSSRWFWA